MTTEFKVPDASCGHCKETIETAVSAIEGVRGAELDLDTKKLSVQHDPSLQIESVVSSIKAAGYTPEVTG